MENQITQFCGWTNDCNAAEDYLPARIDGYAQTVFYISFVAFCVIGVIDKQTTLEVPRLVFAILGITSLISFATGLVAHRLKSKTPPICRGCRKPMTQICTVPSDEEIEENSYIKGESGHVYIKVRDSETWQNFTYHEIKHAWYACETCKRYFVAQKCVKSSPLKIDDREEEYARINDVRRSLQGKKIIIRK